VLHQSAVPRIAVAAHEDPPHVPLQFRPLASKPSGTQGSFVAKVADDEGALEESP
jgi:hypothetical protein